MTTPYQHMDIRQVANCMILPKAPFDKVRLLEIEPLVENHILSSFQNVADEKILCIPLDLPSGEGPY